MRLGQLARQLEVPAQHIIEFLKGEGISISEHPNSKFPEEYEKKVLQHFGASISEEVAPEPEVPAMEVEEQPEKAIEEDPPITKAEPVVGAEPTPIIEEAAAPEEPEVIKAPKIELPGLKVVGKIELPQPKQKVEVASELVAESSPVAPDPKGRKGKFEKNRLTPEEREAKRQKLRAEKKKQEEWEAHKKKLKEERERKKAKARFYEERVKQKSTQAPAKKPKNKKVSPVEETDSRPKPKTLLGKIWRWLNT